MGNANMPNLVTRTAQIIKNIWRSGNFLQGRNLLDDVYNHFMDTPTTLTDGAISKSSSITSFVMLGNDGVPTTSHFEVLVSYGWVIFWESFGFDMSRVQPFTKASDSIVFFHYAFHYIFWHYTLECYYSFCIWTLKYTWT